MAQQLQTAQGVISIPGSYAQAVVQSTSSSVAANGVLAILGESDQGPAFSEEADLSQNLYGPDQVADIVAKYGSGFLPDAISAAVSANADPRIVGSIQRIIPVKTNTGIKSTGTLPAIGSGTYADLIANSAGKRGNLITRSLTVATAEALPTTGAVLIAPPQVSTIAAFRVDGGSEVTATLSVGELPSAIVTAIDGLSGVAASGGTNRGVLAGGNIGDSLTMTLDTGFKSHLTTGATFSATPSVGDILYIPTGSPFSAANEGSYVVLVASNTRLDLYKLLDAAGGGTARSAPTTETVTVAAATDVAGFAPTTITLEAGAVVPGLGKSLEIAESGSNHLANNVFAFAGATTSIPAAPVTFVSTSTSPQVLAAAAEYKVSLNTARQADGITEAMTAGGDVVLTLGYKGTTGSAVIAGGIMTITVTGGAGASPAAITLSDFPTINDLVTYLNTLTGFTAAAATAAMGSLASATLDPGTYGIASSQGAPVGRIKADGQEFIDAVNGVSVLLSVLPAAPATQLIGLPDVASLAFLAGGARGATTDTLIQAAFTALESVQLNFVAPAFSRDATADIADKLTDASSTYTIAAIHAQLKSHVLLMSQFKRRKRRQGFAGFRGTYSQAKAAAGNLATQRVAMTFMDVRDLSATGVLKQQQPWDLAVKAASMQAAGLSEPIVAKFVNISGALQAAGDFNDQTDSQVEDALESGLLFVRKVINANGTVGGFKWVSDQTTYSADDNFVFNSIQATYLTDLICATVEQRMDAAFTGRNVADISIGAALTVFDRAMTDCKNLKFIAPDDSAPKGYLTPTVRIEGGGIRFSVTVKLAGANYFSTADIFVQPVQSAG